MQDWHAYAKILTALIVIADPVGAVPFFLSLTDRHSVEERRHTAKVTATTVALVLVVALFFGKPLLEVFGITIASFRVAGGLLLLLMAIAMLHAHPTRAYHTTEQVIQDEGGRHSVAVVPLAVPLVAGPGAVSTVILYSHQATTWFDTAFLVLASLFVALVLWFTLRMADPISRVLGKTGINLVTHLMGLVLAAVAVEFITAGLAELLPGLGVRN